jgi:ribose-phosphate pyrophosphokinase
MMNILVISRAGGRYAKALAKRLRANLLEYKIKQFADGEIEISLAMPTVATRVLLVADFANIGQPAINGEFLGLLTILRRLEVAHVIDLTLLVPYLAYSRATDLASSPLILLCEQLKKFKKAKLYTLDVHDTTLFAAYPDLIYSLDTSALWAELLKQHIIGAVACIVSPDEGGAVRSRRLAAQLQVPVHIFAKQRAEDNVVLQNDQGGQAPDYTGMTVIIRDDLVATGSTALAAAQWVKKNGASRIIGCFTHAVCSTEVMSRLQQTIYQDVFFMHTAPCNTVPCSIISIEDFLVTTVQNELELHHDEHSASQAYSYRASV